MERNQFREMLRSAAKEKTKIRANFLKSCEMFKELTENERVKVSLALEEKLCADGDIVYSIGDEGMSFT